MNLAPIDVNEDAIEDQVVDAALRAFVEAEVPPLPPGQDAGRDRIVRRMEAVRAGATASRRRQRRQAWAVFAVAACLPALAWAARPWGGDARKAPIVADASGRAGLRHAECGALAVIDRGASPLAAPPTNAPAAAPEEGLAARSGSATASTLAAENALLADAMRLRRDRRSSRATEELDELLARYPGSPLGETARVERLRALQDSGAYARLAREAQAYLDEYPRGFARAEASQMVDAARARAP